MPTDHAGQCPKCGEFLEPDAVLCINCGHHLKMGVNAKTVSRAKFAGRTGIAIIVSALGSILGGLLWAGIVVLTGFEAGYVAIGVGFLAGGGIVLMTSERGPKIGAIAVTLAIVDLLIGKILIFQWGVPKMLVRDLYDETDSAVTGCREKRTGPGICPGDCCGNRFCRSHYSDGIFLGFNLDALCRGDRLADG